VNGLFELLLLGLWVAGIVLASGWWKLLAIAFPFYSFYLGVEKLLTLMGWV